MTEIIIQLEGFVLEIKGEKYVSTCGLAKEHNKPRLLLLLMAFFRLITSGKTLSAASKNNKKVRNKSKITLKYKCRKGEAMKKKLKEERNVWISKGHSSGIKSLCLME